MKSISKDNCLINLYDLIKLNILHLSKYSDIKKKGSQSTASF